MDRRRRGRPVRGVFLLGTRRDVSALERRVQLSRPGLSPGLRFSGRLCLGHRRLRGAGGAGRDGVRRVRQVGLSRRAAVVAGGRRGLAGVAGATHRRPAFLDLSVDRDHPQGAADRGLPGLRIRDRHAAAGQLRAVRFRLQLYRQRAVRDQPGVRDVFVLRLECRDLHHRRGAPAGAQRAARDADGNADRAGALCRAQCRVPAHRADRQARGPARCCPDFRQLHFRRVRRPHRRRHDLLRADLLDQCHDVDRAARDDDDGRGHSDSAGVLGRDRPVARRPTPSCFSSSSRP